MLLIKQCSMHVIHLINIQGTYSMHAILLKGQCHKFFASGFFQGQSPPAPDYPIWTVWNLFENSGRYSQVKVHHRFNDTGSKFCYQFRWCCWYQWQSCHRCQRYRRNLPPVSIILAEICHQWQWRQWQLSTSINNTCVKFVTCVNNIGGKQWEQYQTADNLKWTWKKNVSVC